MRDLKSLGLNWSEINTNVLYNVSVIKGDCLYYSSSNYPIFKQNLIVLEKSEDSMIVCFFSTNRKSEGFTKEIYKTHFDNKLLFTYA